MSDFSKSHDPETIVKSEVFKALNLIIDGHAGELERLEHSIRLRMQEFMKPVPYGGETTITLRVSYESGKRLELKRLFNSFDLKHLSEIIERICHLEEQIGELQRFKLRLLSLGDPAAQFAVFGAPDE